MFCHRSFAKATVHTDNRIIARLHSRAIATHCNINWDDYFIVKHPVQAYFDKPVSK